MDAKKILGFSIAVSVVWAIVFALYKERATENISTVEIVSFGALGCLILWRTCPWPSKDRQCSAEKLRPTIEAMVDSRLSSIKPELVQPQESQVQEQIKRELALLFEVEHKGACGRMKEAAKICCDEVRIQASEIFRIRARQIERGLAEILEAAVRDPVRFEEMLDFQRVHGKLPNEHNVNEELNNFRQARLAYDEGGPDWHTANISVQKMKFLLACLKSGQGPERTQAELGLARARRQSYEPGSKEFELMKLEVQRLKTLLL